MKKTVCFILCILILMSLCACGGSDKPAEAPAADPAPAEEPVSAAIPAQEQLDLISASTSVWLKDDQSGAPYSYAVTDLDGNGRLEVFCACVVGSGSFTYGGIYELNEAGTALEKAVIKDDPEELIPEVTVLSADRYADKAGTRAYYIFSDMARNGYAETTETLTALSLSEGVITLTPIASHYYNATGPAVIETYTSASGAQLGKAQFEGAAAQRYADLDKSSVNFGWFISDGSSVSKQLENSYKVFCGQLDRMPEAPAPVQPDNKEAENQQKTGSITVTKNPTGETIAVGGGAWFIAHADNAEKISWQLLDKNNAPYSLDEAMKANPGLSLTALEGDTLALASAPESINGWMVQAVFTNTNATATSAPALISVFDFAKAYKPVLDNYAAAYASGSINAGTAEQYGISELAGYSDAAGYFLTDLNSDSVPELIIGGIGSRNDENPLYSVYTLDSAMQPVNILTGSARDRWFLLSNNTLYNFGSSGAAYSSHNIYSLSGAVLNMLQGVRSDLDADSKPIWLRSVNGSEAQVSEAEAQSIIDSYNASIVAPSYTEIS